MTMSAAVWADQPTATATAGARPAAAPAATVDNSSRFYTKQSDSGATVLGNGAAEEGATPLALRAPAVVGTLGGTATAAPKSGRPGAAAVSAALSGNAPAVDYTSSAVRDDLRQRDEKIAQRVVQMYHRKSGLSGNAAGGATAPDAGK